MPLQLNFVEIGFEITIDPNTPRKQGQYVRGLFRLLEYMKDKTFLMIPGPTPVPENVMLEIAKHPIGNRSSEFSKILESIFIIWYNFH